VGEHSVCVACAGAPFAVLEVFTPGGVLLCCCSDEPTIEFIKHFDDTGGARFIIECIDPTHVFVQADALERIQRAVRARDQRNTYTKVDATGSMAEDGSSKPTKPTKRATKGRSRGPRSR